MVEALETIDRALQTEEAADPFCWYVKGFIHKQIFTTIDEQGPDSPNRNEAVAAVRQSIALDSDGQWWDNNQKAIRFLAITYYNDALRLSQRFSSETPDQPEQLFQAFQEAMVLAEPSYDFTLNQIDFYKHMAAGYIRLYHAGGETEKALITASTDFYKQALALAPEDYKANYNLAINFYNQGVRLIRKINHNTDIFQLLSIQDECVILFQQALPFMESAHAQQPERVETLKGLMAIHRALSDRETSDVYKAKLEAIIGKQ